MGKLILVQGPSLDSEPPHSFDQVSRIARADKRLSDRGYRVLATIEGYCWGDRRDCWVSNRTLGEESGGVSARTTCRAIRELEQLGYLKTVPDLSKIRGHRLVLLYQLKRPGLPD
jgi:hypothetical protein